MKIVKLSKATPSNQTHNGGHGNQDVGGDLRRGLWFLLIVTLALAACTPTQTPTPVLLTQTPTLSIQLPSATNRPTNTPTLLPPRPTSTPTATPQKTSVPSFTPVIIPTATSYGPFSATGPHLAYLVTASDGKRSLTILNADASGREIIPIPDDAIIGDLNNALSPSGEWLAFHTGSDGDPGNIGRISLTSPLDLTLRLMHLPDGRITTISGLLSKDYPANFDKLAPYLIQTDSRYSQMDLNSAENNIEELFLGGIRGLSWSPNSRYLAFAGEMDGPSSDLYLYDAENSSIKRLTDGLGQMTGFISWSPDSKWILHGSDNEPFGEGMRTDLFVVRYDGKEAKKIDNSTNEMGQWISPTYVLVHESENGVGDHNLRMDNVETGESKLIWSDSFENYTFDQNSGTFAVCDIHIDYYQGQILYGVYLFLPDKPQQYIPTNFDCQVDYRGPYAHKFIASYFDGNSDTVFYIAGDKLVPIKPKSSLMSISPDHRWMLLNIKTFEFVYNVELYDENDQFVKELLNTKPDALFWRPDSVGIYYQLDGSLFYMRIPDGEPVLVEKSFGFSGPIGTNYRWIQ